MSKVCDKCGKPTALVYRKYDLDLCAVCAPKMVRAMLKAKRRWDKQKEHPR